MTIYEVTLVSRIPQVSAWATGAEVDRLVVSTISYTEELNRPGSAALSCPIRSLSDAVKNRLANMATLPSEAWIYRNGAIAWVGEVQALAVQDQSLNLSCVGLLGYTFRMGVTADLVYTGVDQFTIAKGLVDHWQNQAYGHYAIDTAGIGLSGVTRDRTYLQKDLHNIGTRLQELGAVSDGFDTYVDPATRALVLSYPQRGIDLTGSVFLDARNIDNASIVQSIAPDDLITDISATGTAQTSDGTSLTLYTQRENTALRASHGRSWGSQTFDGVSVQATLNGHADAHLDARNGQLFQPGLTVMARVGAEPGDFHPGDTLAYSYDAGIGLQTATLRVAKVKVDVGADGQEKLGIEMA